MFGLDFLLPTGNVTLAVLGLMIVVLIAAGILEIGIRLVKLAIAADDENAPDIQIGNFVSELILKFVPKSHITKDDQGYTSEINIFGYVSRRFAADDGCHTHLKFYFKTYNEAKEAGEKVFNRYYSQALPSCRNVRVVLGLSLCTDLIIYLLSLWFIPTLCLLGLVGTIFSTRFIAKKLYKNMAKTENHEERITKLEGDDE